RRSRRGRLPRQRTPTPSPERHGASGPFRRTDELLIPMSVRFDPPPGMSCHRLQPRADTCRSTVGVLGPSFDPRDKPEGRQARDAGGACELTPPVSGRLALAALGGSRRLLRLLERDVITRLGGIG